MPTLFRPSGHCVNYMDYHNNLLTNLYSSPPAQSLFRYKGFRMKFPITNLHTIALLKILQKFPIAIKGRSQLLIRAYQDFWSSLSFCLLPHLPIHYTTLQLYWITYSNLHKPCLLSLLAVCLGFSLSKSLAISSSFSGTNRDIFSSRKFFPAVARLY